MKLRERGTARGDGLDRRPLQSLRLIALSAGQFAAMALIAPYVRLKKLSTLRLVSAQAMALIVSFVILLHFSRLMAVI